MYLKIMSKAMKESITCVDCGIERKVTKACLKLITRCKPCQVIFNRVEARNRYRKKHDISLVEPVKKPEPKKKKKEIKSNWLKPIEPVNPPSILERTPEEQIKHDAAMAKLFKLFDDGSTTDDW